MDTLTLTAASRTTAGILLLTIVTIEYGGWFLTKVVRGSVPMTDFQQSFARAGHAHAGVLVMLGLIGLLYVDSTNLTGVFLWLGRSGVPIAAILMSAGFFVSSGGKNVTTPNRLIWLVWIGALFLAGGVLSLGVGLLTA
jgi:hypothetical protein